MPEYGVSGRLSFDGTVRLTTYIAAMPFNDLKSALDV